MSAVQTTDRPGCKDIHSPLGQLRLIASAGGLSAMILEGENDQPTKLIGPVRNCGSPPLRLAERQLQAYFDGQRRRFDYNLATEGSGFQKRVWAALLHVSFGETRSYGDLARGVAENKTVRAVGNALPADPVVIIIPCHRIIGRSGTFMGGPAGLDNKTVLLEPKRKHCAPGLFGQLY